MANINNLRNEFIFCKKKIENALYLKSYSEAKNYIEQASKILAELNKCDNNFENRKHYRELLAELQRNYDICKQKLGEVEVVAAGPSATAPKKNDAKPSSKPHTQKVTSKSNQGEGNDSEDGIQYVFNGIDVRPFLANEVNEVVTFDDVIGMKKEKELIKNEFFLTEEDIEFNKAIGKKNKNFILLYGLPGTGKTFFAKAVSYELGQYFGGKIPFYCVVCGTLKGKYQGETENRVNALFEFTKQFERCVIFMDEFEMIGISRQKDISEVTASTVATLLQMLDGFSSNKGLLLIAATNVPYNLDTAILSRVHAQIEVPLPSYDIIYPILKRKIGKFVAEDVNLEKLAKRLDGYSNRDVSRFISVVLDIYANEHRKDKSKTIDQFRITNEYIERALEDAKSSINEDEVIRLQEYKNTNK